MKKHKVHQVFSQLHIWGTEEIYNFLATVHVSQTESRRRPHHTQPFQHCASRHTEGTPNFPSSQLHSRARLTAAVSVPPPSPLLPPTCHLPAPIHALPFPYLARLYTWLLFILTISLSCMEGILRFVLITVSRWCCKIHNPNGHNLYIPDSVSSLPLVVFLLKITF